MNNNKSLFISMLVAIRDFCLARPVTEKDDNVLVACPCPHIHIEVSPRSRNHQGALQGLND